MSGNGQSSTGILRPDARDVFTDVGNALADPFAGRVYPWVNPPPGFVLINRRATIPAPANGVQTQITSFTCPQAMNAIITHVLNVFTGTDVLGNSGSGKITWVIDINRPLGAVTGFAPPDFASITTQLGSVSNFPWPVPGGIYLDEQMVIRYKVTTLAPVGVGGNNFVTAMFLGWMWPSRLPATGQKSSI